MRTRRSSASSSPHLRSRTYVQAPVFSWFYFGIMRKLTYKEKFIQMDREASATAICAVIIMAAFWAALLLLKDSPETLFEMPLWFSVSCLGGYVLSVVAVIVLVKRFFRDFDLDQDAPKETETTETTKGDAA